MNFSFTLPAFLHLDIVVLRVLRDNVEWIKQQTIPANVLKVHLR